MRFERLVIEAGSNTFSLQLHPRFTVVAGLEPAEREAIAGELIGALGPCRSGVHLEVTERRGRRLAIFRPDGARHRVLDMDGGSDVSEEFTCDEGEIDVFHRYRLDARDVRRSLKVSPTDLQANAQSNDLVRKLADLDQTELWSGAARVRVTDDELSIEAEAAGAQSEDAQVVAKVEVRHLEFEKVLAFHQRLRKFSIVVGASSGVAGLVVAASDILLSFPVFAIGLLATGMAMLYRRRVDEAEQNENEALDDAGAQTYLGFHMQRVNGLLSSEVSRRRLLAAAEDHHEAVAAWTAIAGSVTVDWALDHHEEITATARLSDDMRSIEALMAAPSTAEEGAIDLAQALVARLAAARSLGKGHEGFPLILDEAFDGTSPAVRSRLLELLARDAGSPQVVLLTNDEAVSSWARLESITGAVTVLEPNPGPTEDMPTSTADQVPATRAEPV